MLTQRLRRTFDIGNDTCLLGFSGRDSVDTALFDTSTLTPGGVTEVQSIAITGTPTGGTFTLSFKGQTTAPIAWNASAATVQAALRLLGRVGAVTCAGGALPGTPVSVTFTGKNALQDVPLLSINTAALTGGTPVGAVTVTTQGDATFAGLLILKSGTPLMATADGKKVQPWDGVSAAALVGIFDGQREFLDVTDIKAIPVYNHECVFDKAVVLNYATWTANYNTWAAAHACQFKSQGV